WEHGHIHTLARYGPRLLAAGLARGRPSLVALGLDLLVPPLALLVMLLGATLAAGVAAHQVGLAPLAALAPPAVGLGAVAAAVGATWIGFGRATLPLRYALV